MKKQKIKNRGITLIALVITIIVMLILVAVTISMAINGGLFGYAGKAVGDTNSAMENEKQLTEGRLKVGDTWYNSIGDYLNKIPSSNQDVEENPEITDTPNEDDELNTIQVGDYISNYPVTYTNISEDIDEKYTGWRVISTDGSNIKLITAGVPLGFSGDVWDEMSPPSVGAEKSIAALGTGFLNTQVDLTGSGKLVFNSCGFILPEGETTLKNVFVNEFTNSVRAFSAADIAELTGEVDLYSKKFDNSLECFDLIFVPRVVLLPDAWEDAYKVGISVMSDGTFSEYNEYANGNVRVVVTLASDIQFTPADEKINNTTTWEISL